MRVLVPDSSAVINFSVPKSTAPQRGDILHEHCWSKSPNLSLARIIRVKILRHLLGVTLWVTRKNEVVFFSCSLFLNLYASFSLSFVSQCIDALSYTSSIQEEKLNGSMRKRKMS